MQLGVRWLFVVGLLALISMIGPPVPSAQAAIKATAGAVVKVSPPPSVMHEAYTSNTEIRAFDEQQDFVTPIPIVVDLAPPGSATTIPAGTCVESHYLHFDNVRATTLVRLRGSVTFDADVLGVIVTDARLSSTDATLGVTGTAYPTGLPARGAETTWPVASERDFVTIAPNGRTVSVDLAVSGVIDNVRVITECGIGPPANLVLTPETATNPVDTQHCVTATVTDAAGTPTPDVTVRFAVTGATSTSGSATTKPDGTAQFCYMGPPLPGTDTIRAYADTNNSGSQDMGEPTDVATKIWVLPVTTPGCEVTITNGGWIRASNGDKATFGGNAKADAGGRVSGQEEYQDHGPARSLTMHSINVLAVVCSADRTEARVYGQARVDGTGPHNYRIRVRDQGEPGTSDMYGIILSPNYTSGDQPPQGGNIQIR